MHLAERIDREAELAVAVRPVLNVVTFRHLGGDEINRAIPAAIGPAASLVLRGTVVGGREVLRAWFMHPDTTVADVDRIVPAVLAAADGIRRR